MRFAILPAILLALAGSFVTNAAEVSASTSSGSMAFSAAAQATSTATVEAGTTVTTTAEVAATGTVTGTGATPVPLPTQVPPPSFGNPFDPAFLFSRPDPPVGPFGWLFLALSVALTAVSGYFYMVKRPQWKKTNSVFYRAAQKWAQIGLWIGVLGIIFLLFRVIGLDFFNMRIWLYLLFLSMLAALGWFFYWYRTQLPQQMERFTRRQKAKQYAPGTVTGRGPSRPVPEKKTSKLTPKLGGTPPPAPTKPTRTRKQK